MPDPLVLTAHLTYFIYLHIARKEVRIKDGESEDYRYDAETANGRC